MTTKPSLLAALSTLMLASPATAETGFDRPMRAATDLFEIAVGGGYLQIGGESGIGGLETLAGPGGHAEVQLGHRIGASLVLGGYGTLAGFSAGSSLEEATNDVIGASVGVKADWHFRPARTVDPWVSVGGGLRWLRVERGATNPVSLRGADLARLQVGIDYRITEAFAIAPALGATATMYFDHDTPMTAGYEAIDDKKVSWTFSAGLLGRFDL